jgi:hypothetical protein
VIAIVSYNASNNDTMMEFLEDRFMLAGAEFNASAARVRCIPHTINLAANKVHVVH